MTDFDGNTAIWDAISAKHHSIFKILYHWASVSDPYIAGDLLCTAARRNDVAVMKELLKHGLYVDSKDRHGLTAIHVATTENHLDMVQFLLMNGSEVNEIIENSIPSVNLDEMRQNCELGHSIFMNNTPDDHGSRENENDKDSKEERAQRLLRSRISIYRGHPINRRADNCTEPGKLIKMPNSLVELKSIAGLLL